MAGERGLRASPPSSLTWTLALALLLVACGGPEGPNGPNEPPSGSHSAFAAAGGTADDPAAPASGSGSDSSPAGRAGDLRRLGSQDLETAPYPVEDALAADGGVAVASMLRALGVDPADVDLALAVGAGGDPTISDWHLPGASAEAILAAWRTSAPGSWSSTTLGDAAAMAGEGLDGSSAWAVATDGRFVYIRTEQRALAEEVARIVGG